jgi:SagB-type dehydrogenase family enzyme
MSVSDPSPDLRPLAQAVARRDGDGLAFDVGPQVVHVRGDLDLVEEVLGLCDGRRTVGEIAAEVGDEVAADVSELVGTLAQHRVVVDCAEAWRLFHRQSSVGSGLYRAVDEATVLELQRQAFRPQGLLDRVESLRSRRGEVHALAERRASAVPARPPRPPTFAELSTLLSAMYGHGEAGGRPVPSAGALYPLILHAAVRSPLPPLEPGLWWYDPAADALRLASGDRAEAADLFVPQPVSDALLTRQHPVIFVSAELRRPSRKYASRSYRFALMEAGAAMQNAYLAGAELGLPVRAVAGFDDDRAHAYLSLPDGSVVLLAVLVGS